MNNRPHNCLHLVSCTLFLVLLLTACRPPPHVAQVQRLVEDGAYDKALFQVKRSLGKYPGDNALWKLLIHIHFAREDVKGAVGAYRLRAKKVGPDKELARYLSLLLLRWGMEHKDPTVRLDALQGVRSTDATALLRDMIARLSDPNEEVRTWAAVAMSASPQGADVLEEQLSSSSPAARAVAVEQVGRIAGVKAMSALFPHVKDREPRVRAAAARALAWCKSREALPHLTALLSDREWQVQAAAARALGRLGFSEGAAPLKPLLASPRLGVKLAALDALTDLDREMARPLLQEAARGRDFMVALRAGVRLAGLGQVQPALDIIARTLVAGKGSARAAACNAASQVKDTVAADLVIRALKDPEPRVRLAAGRALLAHRRGPEVLDAARALHRLACPAGKNPAPSLCLQAAELMALLGQPEGAATLATLARSGPTGQLRNRALSLALRHQSSHDLALSALTDADPHVVVAAAIWFYGQLK